MRKIIIRAGGIQASAELNDTRTADAVWNALPFSGAGNTWVLLRSA